MRYYYNKTELTKKEFYREIKLSLRCLNMDYKPFKKHIKESIKNYLSFKYTFENELIEMIVDFKSGLETVELID